MKKKQNVFLVGPMGAGKTTIGRQLAKQLNMDFYDSDQEIEASTGADISWIFEIEGPEGFLKREEKAIEKLVAFDNIVLATGGGAVASAENRKRLASRGIVVYLSASLGLQQERTSYDDRRPMVDKNNPKASIERLDQERRPLYESLADVTFATDGSSVRSIVESITAWLREQQHGG